MVEVIVRRRFQGGLEDEVVVFFVGSDKKAGAWREQKQGCNEQSVGMESVVWSPRMCM